MPLIQTLDDHFSSLDAPSNSRLTFLFPPSLRRIDDRETCALTCFPGSLTAISASEPGPHFSYPLSNSWYKVSFVWVPLEIHALRFPNTFVTLLELHSTFTAEPSLNYTQPSEETFEKRLLSSLTLVPFLKGTFRDVLFNPITQT